MSRNKVNVAEFKQKMFDLKTKPRPAHKPTKAMKNKKVYNRNNFKKEER